MKMVAFLMLAAKLATLGLFKLKIFLRYSNHIVDAIM